MIVDEASNDDNSGKSYLLQSVLWMVLVTYVQLHRLTLRQWNYWVFSEAIPFLSGTLLICFRRSSSKSLITEERNGRIQFSFASLLTMWTLARFR